MSSEELHAPLERLSDATIATHQAIVSLMEELQAMDWYRQRADDCDDPELTAVLIHNMNDEMEHAAMLVEWLRCNVDEFDVQLEKFLHTDGPIVPGPYMTPVGTRGRWLNRASGTRHGHVLLGLVSETQ